jgi:hypothetical protein
MAAQTHHSYDSHVEGFSDVQGTVALWALLDVLGELPGSPEDQHDLQDARCRVGMEVREFRLSESDLRGHARELLETLGTVLPPEARSPDPGPMPRRERLREADRGELSVGSSSDRKSPFSGCAGPGQHSSATGFRPFAGMTQSRDGHDTPAGFDPSDG